MNEILVTLGIESWKPVIGALLLPPVPFVLLTLIGGRLMFRNRLLAWALLLIAASGTWLSCTQGASTLLMRGLLMTPRPLSATEMGDLKKAPKTAIVVLGAGRNLLAPEYGVSSLTNLGQERLRYGLWLSRETGLPVAFSGGVAHGARSGPSEAEIASRIAERDFNRTLKWTETLSRDTNENASRSLALMREAGIERIVLVTHGFHMRRALAAFERAKQRSGSRIELIAAPMGLGDPAPLTALDWLPSRSGFTGTNIALHEWLGRLLGA